MNNEEARIFIRSYLDFVSTMHVGKEGKDPVPPLSKAFRAKIHSEFDMDDDKARACRKFGRQQIKKSIALAQEGLLLQSIDKAQRAMFLRPDDPKPLVMLMRLYMPKYRNEPDKAKFYAQHVLLLDPSHQRANELLSDTDEKPSKSKYLMGASLAACIVFGGLFYTQGSWVPLVEKQFFSSASTEDTGVSAQQSEEPRKDSGTEESKKEKEPEKDTEKEEETIPKNPALPLSIDKGGAGFAIEERGSTWYTAERSLTYDLRAVLHNKSATAYGVMTGTVSVLDENDLPIVQKFQELHTFFELPLYPEQSHPLAIRLYVSDLPENMPTPTRVIVDFQDKVEDLNPRPDMIDVPIEWKAPEGSTQSVQVQQRVYIPEEKDGTWNHAVAFEVTNTGTDIRRLHMRFVFLDDEKKELAKTDTLVTFTDRPLMAPQEKRVVTIRETTPEPVSSIEVSILELE